jgi:hypothetical protein
MKRARWTDDLLDHRMAAMDEKFDRLFIETRAVREEMRVGFSELRGEISELRRDLLAFQRHVTLIVAAFAVGLLGLLSAGQL